LVRLQKALTSVEGSLVANVPVSPIKFISSSLCSSPRMQRLSCNSLLDVFIQSSTGQTILTLPFLAKHRSVPTEEQILVPETLLKKRKSQEKQREERQAELQKKKKVRHTDPFAMHQYQFKGQSWTMVMTNTILATRPSGRCCRLY
jgi:hypothetical protein